MFVQPVAVQLDDGSLDDGRVIEGPGVHVAVGGQPLTVGQARRLAVERCWRQSTIWRRYPAPARLTRWTPSACPPSWTKVARRIRRADDGG